MLVKLGVKKKNIWLCDKHGLVYAGRKIDMNSEKSAFAQNTNFRSLEQVIENADMFLGLSGPNVLKPALIKKMNAKPIIFALANPSPEIMPDIARKAAPDAIIATGRSDFFNQVNNVLCFPFIFRGALDVEAMEINDEMQLACIDAIAEIARTTTSAEAAAAYQGESLTFGPEYLICLLYTSPSPRD